MPETGQDEDAIERLIAETRSSDVYERLRAAEQLGAIGDTLAVQPLIALLRDRAYQVVETALTSLGNLGDPRAVEVIAAVFSDRDMMATMSRAGAISTAAAEALRKLGEPGFQALTRLLRQHLNSEFEGVALVLALGQVKDPRSFDTLTVALHSPIWEVNRAAAYTLAKFGEVAVPVLVAALESPNGWVAHHARQALSLFGATPLPSLVELLRASETGYVHAEAVQAIASIDDPQVPEILRSALTDADEQVRRAAVEALGERRDPSAVEQLLGFPIPAVGYQDPAVRILAGFGFQAAALLDVLHDREHPAEARARAAEVLGKVGAMDAVGALISALRDDDDGVRRAAAGALGELKDARAVEPLLEVFAGGTPDMQTSALAALSRFHDARAFDALAGVAGNSHENTRRRSGAVMTLLHNYKDQALPVLRQLALAAHGDPRENPDTYVIASLAVVALSSLGRPGTQVIITVAQSGEASLCLHALRQLQKSSTQMEQEDIDQVAALLSDPRAPVRHHAAIVLGEHGDPRAIEPLLASLRYPAPRVGQEAARALGKVGDERAVSALEQAFAETWNADVSQSQQRSAEFELRDTIEHAILSIRGRQYDRANRAKSEK